MEEEIKEGLEKEKQLNESLQMESNAKEVNVIENSAVPVVEPNTNVITPVEPTIENSAVPIVEPITNVNESTVGIVNNVDVPVVKPITNVNESTVGIVNNVDVPVVTPNVNTDSNEQNSSISKKKRIIKGLLLVLFISLIVSGCIGLGLMLDDKISNKDNDVESSGDDKNDGVKDSFKKVDGIVTIDIDDYNLVKLSSLTPTDNLYLTDINSGNDNVVYSGYDGYYVVLDGTDYYLKRNQNIVSKIEKDILKVYKDESSKNSKYISVFCFSSFAECSVAEVVDEEYAFLSIMSKYFLKAIIFNINTGNYKVYDDSYVNVIPSIDKTIFTHETKDKESIVSLDDFSLFTAEDFFIVGDSAKLGVGDGFNSHSSKYVVIKTTHFTDNGKYGLADYKMNKVIDLIYDDLVTINDDLLIAKLDGKYGVIDYTNKAIIDFEYDGIEAVNDYYVVLKDGKLGVLNKNGKEVIPFSYDVPTEKEHNLRLCCGDINYFKVYKSDNSILISYSDANKTSSNYPGYESSYIILYENGTYSDAEVVSKKYNFSDEYYTFVSNDSNLEVYDMNKKLVKTLICNEGAVYSNKFVDKDIFEYVCGGKKHYYNLKLDREVLNDEISFEEKNIESLNLKTINGSSAIYYNGKKKLTLNKGDNFSSILIKNSYLYELKKSNGTVEYYELNKIYK